MDEERCCCVFYEEEDERESLNEILCDGEWWYGLRFPVGLPGSFAKNSWKAPVEKEREFLKGKGGGKEK